MDMLNHLLNKGRSSGGGGGAAAAAHATCWCAVFGRGGWTMLKWHVICVGAHDWDCMGPN